LRAVQAGKNVLLEKPCTSNATEAEKLFNHPRVTASDAPVVLEAFHYRFHPAWQKFISLIHKDPLAGPVKTGYSQSYMLKGYFDRGDIRFNFALSGGSLMDFATYNISNLRQIFNDQHPQVQTVDFRKIADQWPGTNDSRLSEQIDVAVKATYKSNTGAVGRINADLVTAGGWPLLPSSWTRNWPSIGWPKCVAELEEKQVDNQTLGEGETHFVQRTVTMYNHLMPHLYHSLVVEDKHSIKDGSKVTRSWTEKKNIKEYDWSDKSDGRQGAYWWPTYRYQLEEFVHRVKGRKGNGIWIDGQDSINQMKVIDETYTKGGLEIRPTSSFALST
jgi:predicted dehydrogenase